MITHLFARRALFVAGSALLAAMVSSCADLLGTPRGELSIVVTGLPPDIAANVSVKDPGGSNAVLTSSSASVTRAGEYVITAKPVGPFPVTYRPGTPTMRLTLERDEKRVVNIDYAMVPGGANLTVTGLPSDLPANVVVSGPQNFREVVTTRAWHRTDLVPGTYTVNALSVTRNGGRYDPQQAASTFVVVSDASTDAQAQYDVVPGTMNVTVSGLPAGANGKVIVTGDLTAWAVVATQALTLIPGAYAITAAPVSVPGAGTYVAQVSVSSTQVNSEAVVNVAVTYASIAGNIAISATGLPSGLQATARVTGPAGFNQIVTIPGTVSHVDAGSYTVAPQTAITGVDSYNPTPLSISVTVSAASTAAVTVDYTRALGTLDLSIEQVYLIQIAQDYQGSIPMIAGRNALLRVFAKANQSNNFAVPIRVQLFAGSALVQTYTLTGPAAVPTSVDESSTTLTWSQIVPASLIQPGLRILADIDPGNAVPEGNESNNFWPVTAQPQPIAVNVLAPLDITFVPIRDGAGVTGNITSANSSAMMAGTLDRIPTLTSTVQIRAPLQVAERAISDNEWQSILNQLRLARIADGSTRNYYGVVPRTTGSVYGGLGYVGYPAAIGQELSTLTTAHELGHNFGRLHAPCGGPGGPDPAYPFSDGRTGTYGWNGTSLIPPTIKDFMSYCDPEWISGYNYQPILMARSIAGNTSNAAAVRLAKQRTVLVSGQVSGGVITLDPSYTITTNPALPSGSGPYRLVVRAPDGAVLYDGRFTPDEIDHDANARAFAFAIPIPSTAVVASIDVSGPNGVAGLRAATLPATNPAAILAPSQQRIDGGRVRVRWDPRAGSDAMIRDPATGAVIAFVRGGDATVWYSRGTVEVVVASLAIRQ